MTGLLIVALVLILVGVVGTVVPGLPGVTLVLLGMFIAAYDTGFTRVGYGTLSILAVLTMLTFAVEFFATLLGAKKVGASKLAMIGAALGTIGGLMLGIVGVLIGPFIGALLGEMLHQRKHPRDSIGHASKVGVGAWIGFFVGTLLKIVLVSLMLGIFAWAYWRA